MITKSAGITSLLLLAGLAYAQQANAEVVSISGIWRFPWGSGAFTSVAAVCAADAALPAWSQWNTTCTNVVQGTTAGSYTVHACTKTEPIGCSDTYRTSALGCYDGYSLNGTSCVSNNQPILVKFASGRPRYGSCVGNPVNASSGNKYQPETDTVAAGAGTIEFRREYNSIGALRSGIINAHWRTNFDRSIALFAGTSLSTAVAYRPDGNVRFFTLASNNWVSDSDISDALTQLKDASNNPIGWRYVIAADNSSETYDVNGRLINIADRAGLQQTFGYSNGRLVAVTDPYGRSIGLAYGATGRIATMTDPAGGIVSYTYDADGRLTSVTYPDSSVRQYHYENATFKNALTGITDERGVRYATYAYGTDGKATLSEHGGGAGRNSLVYGGNNTWVTDPLGTVRTYAYQTVLGVRKNTGVSQPGGSGCGPAAEALTYDANGNVASRTDFNGRKTTYAYDLSRNLETSRTDGLSSSGAALPETRTITTAWHATWRLPVQIDEYAGTSASGNPVRRTQIGYDDRGNIVSRSITDVAAGVTRTWTTAYTYSAAVPGLVLQKVEDGPRTDVADTVTTDHYPHDETCAGASLGTGRDKGCRGQVKRVTDALGQVTQFTRYNAHGQVEEIVDPNGVTTTLTYDLRQRLTSRSTAGETTSYQYDPVGQLTRLTLPDGSFLAYTYDGARRLTDVADSLGNGIHYTLDAAGNRTQEDIRDPQGALVKTLTRAHDALGRLQTLTGVGNE